MCKGKGKEIIFFPKFEINAGKNVFIFKISHYLCRPFKKGITDVIAPIAQLVRASDS